MTEERKDDILTAALKLIGTHLDEDENVARALSNYLGMTTEEMRECGILPTNHQEQDTRARFEQKLRDCFEQYKAEWLQKRPDTLIEDAEEIASVQRMFKELPGTVTDEDAAYLLRFKNPLEVAADAWQDANGFGSVIDDEMTHMLWELRDRGDAEADYEMEPEYYAPAEPQLQAPELTM